MKKKTPVTILTGSLGAGKSTLLNHLLLQLPSSSRAAVIENEFGDSGGIENQIINPRNGDVYEEVFELSNGCVCCSMRGQLQQTLENLLTRPDPFDLVVVETTGLANPGPVAAAFWVDDELESRFYLDAIVAVVDAKHLQRSLQGAAGPGHTATPGVADDDHVNPVQRQIAYADLVLLNKIDLLAPTAAGPAATPASTDSVADLRRTIATINPLVPVRETERCRVPLDAVVGIRAFAPTAALRQQMVTDCAPSPTDAGAGSSHLPPSVLSRTVSAPPGADVLSVGAVERWLGQLVWKGDDEASTADNFEVYRVKGLISVQGRRYVLQGVFELFEVTELPAEDAEHADGNGSATRIIIIGVNLPAESVLQRDFESACVKKD